MLYMRIPTKSVSLPRLFWGRAQFATGKKKMLRQMLSPRVRKRNFPYFSLFHYDENAKLIVTAHIRRVGKVRFSVCSPLTEGGGMLPGQVSSPFPRLWSQVLSGDAPLSGDTSPPGGVTLSLVPCPFWETPGTGSPSQCWDTPGQDWGTPSQDWSTLPPTTGVPPPQAGLGYPS